MCLQQTTTVNLNERKKTTLIQSIIIVEYTNTVMIKKNGGELMQDLKEKQTSKAILDFCREFQ